jgi:hypothetical protein
VSASLVTRIWKKKKRTTQRRLRGKGRGQRRRPPFAAYGSAGEKAGQDDLTNFHANSAGGRGSASLPPCSCLPSSCLPGPWSSCVATVSLRNTCPFRRRWPGSIPRPIDVSGVDSYTEVGLERTYLEVFGRGRPVGGIVRGRRRSHRDADMAAPSFPRSWGARLSPTAVRA